MCSVLRNKPFQFRTGFGFHIVSLYVKRNVRLLNSSQVTVRRQLFLRLRPTFGNCMLQPLLECKFSMCALTMGCELFWSTPGPAYNEFKYLIKFGNLCALNLLFKMAAQYNITKRKLKSQTEVKLSLIFPNDSVLLKNIVRDVYLLVSSPCVMCCVYTTANPSHRQR